MRTTMSNLADNANLYGAPPAASAVAREVCADPALLAGYPDPYARELAAAAADYLGGGLTAANIVVGAGAGSVLAAAFRAFGGAAGTVAYCVPTFSMVPVYAAAAGLASVEVPFLPGGGVDIEGLRATGASIVYLCSPNNPTGAWVSPAEVRRVVSETSGVVVVDEAYAEFVSTLPQVRLMDRLLVVRTLSKAFGLAGVRVGYAAGPAGMVSGLRQVRGPYQIGAFAERVAETALREDVRWMRECAARMRVDRAALVAELTAVGVESVVGEGNFVLVGVPDARGVTAELAERGFVVRDVTDLPGISGAFADLRDARTGAVVDGGGAVRITVGPRERWAGLPAALRVARDGVRA